MTTDRMKLKTIPFDVHIPNLDGDGTAEIIKIEVQAYTDPETGEDVLAPESMELIEKTQARHMGLMAADEIKELRTRLGLSQDEMSNLLQIGAKSYTRWESGRARPSRSMNVMLCALRDGQLGVNYLRALRNPNPQPGWSTKEAAHWFISSPCDQIEAVQVEFKFSHLSPFRPGSPAILPTWRHLWEKESHSPSSSGYADAFVKALHAVWAEEERTSPSAPRLPSSWEQRESYMKQRFAPYITEEPVSG
jgi:DNA-binding transcriptional regulator YiaG